MKPTGSDGEFERWLEQELRRTVGSAQGPSPRAAQAAYGAASRSGGKALAIKSGFLAAVTGKGAAGLAVAALAVGGGGAAAAATGSTNPSDWGQHVVQVVESCKDQSSGASTAGSDSKDDHGIGQCVSAMVSHNQNGRAHKESDSDDHKSASPKSGKHEDAEDANEKDDDGTGTHSHSSMSSHPSPSPSSRAHQPSGSARD